jgi:hypothetical protein
LVARTTGDATAMIEPLRQTLQSASPLVPYADVQTMRMLLGRQTRGWELGARVFSAFGALALLLASVGLFSVVAFMLGQRSTSLECDGRWERNRRSCWRWEFDADSCRSRWASARASS